jgi:hypothetical protein
MVSSMLIFLGFENIYFVFLRLQHINHSIVNMHILILLVVNHGYLVMIILDLFDRLLNNVIIIYLIGIHYFINKKNKVYHQCYHYGQIFRKIKIHLKQKMHLWLVCIIDSKRNFLIEKVIFGL